MFGATPPRWTNIRPILEEIPGADPGSKRREWVLLVVPEFDVVHIYTAYISDMKSRGWESACTA
jgi:hypothetical protein